MASSSSSCIGLDTTVVDSGDKDIAGANIVIPRAQFSETSHNGRVVLDRTSVDTFALTDLVTCERVPLNGFFEIVFDDQSGRAALISPGDGQEGSFEMVDEILRLDVQQNPDGHCYIISKDGTEPIDLELWKRQYRIGDCMFRLSPFLRTISKPFGLRSHFRRWGQPNPLAPPPPR